MSGSTPRRPRSIGGPTRVCDLARRRDTPAIARNVLALGALVLGAAACASPKDNPAFHDHDPTSGHAPDFMDHDEFTHPATSDR